MGAITYSEKCICKGEIKGRLPKAHDSLWMNFGDWGNSGSQGGFISHSLCLLNLCCWIKISFIRTHLVVHWLWIPPVPHQFRGTQIGCISGPGRFHMLRSNSVHYWSLWSTTRKATTMRSPQTSMRVAIACHNQRKPIPSNKDPAKNKDFLHNHELQMWRVGIVVQTPSLLSAYRRMSSETAVSLEEGTCAEETVQRNETRGGWVSRWQWKLVSFYTTWPGRQGALEGSLPGWPAPEGNNGEMPLSLLLE